MEFVRVNIDIPSYCMALTNILWCTYNSEYSVIDVQLDDKPLLYLIMTFQLDRLQEQTVIKSETE